MQFLLLKNLSKFSLPIFLLLNVSSFPRKSLIIIIAELFPEHTDYAGGLCPLVQGAFSGF